MERFKEVLWDCGVVLDVRCERNEEVLSGSGVKIVRLR